MMRVSAAKVTWPGLALAAIGVCLSMLAAPIVPAVAQQGPPSVAPIVEKLLDAVVNISTTQTLKGSAGIPLPKVPEGSPFEDFFKEFFDKREPQDEQRRVNSLGSGFVIDASGLVVTNNHVIADADEIFINFADGSRLKVEKIIGRDLKTDLALLQVKPAKPLPFVKFGSSDVLRVGDWVMAIGNPFGLGGTLTVGVISAKKRDINSGPYDEFLQTDAAINKGNSGGPLFNMAGEVIGVNTAIISPTGGSIGIGFAVPSEAVVAVIDQLRQFGETRRGWIGVAVQSLTDEIAASLGLSKAEGALVGALTPQGPAAKAGLLAGDIIVKFDGKPVNEMRDLPKVVAQTPIGKTVDVEVVRKGKRETFKMTVDRLVETAQGEDAGKPDEGNSPALPPADVVDIEQLGFKVARINGELRKKFGIADTIEGIVVIETKPGGVAAGKGIKPGDMIDEVTNEKVATPGDVAKRIEAIKSTGRKSALLLIKDPRGDIRFVAVPLAAE